MKLLQEIKIPQESVNDQTVTVIEIYFTDGDFVESGEVLIELETSKATFTIEAKTAGYINYYCEEEDDVEINTTIIEIFDKKEAENKAKNANKLANLDKKVVSDVMFSKQALKLIDEHNLQKNSFNERDFVCSEDVYNLLNIDKEKIVAGFKTKKQAKIQLPDTISKKIPKRKKTEIEYLSFAQGRNLTSTVNIYIDTSTVFDSLNPYLKYFKNALLPVIVFETSKLLKKYPEFNSFFNTDTIEIYKHINIGIAIDMENGLKTVNLPNTNKLSISETENLIFELSNKYIDNKLQIDDLTGITFTITDLSSEGVGFFKPLVNQYNSAILAISANDEKLNRSILSLTFDHRVTEGRKASIFLNELKTRIESYVSENKTATSVKCFKCMKPLTEDYNDVGFIKTITSDGREKYICQTCLQGF